MIEEILDRLTKAEQMAIDEENSKKALKYYNAINDLKNENDRLNNIINELEKWCNNGIKNSIHIAYEQELEYEDVLDKLKALKEDNK